MCSTTYHELSLVFHLERGSGFDDQRMLHSNMCL